MGVGHDLYAEIILLHRERTVFSDEPVTRLNRDIAFQPGEMPGGSDSLKNSVSIRNAIEPSNYLLGS
jgi:hypothetical protein